MVVWDVFLQISEVFVQMYSVKKVLLEILPQSCKFI